MNDAMRARGQGGSVAALPGHADERTARFPTGFVWGVATSAAQIEGGAEEGGRGESIWDRFAAIPGKILDGTTPSIACDHYHRWRTDLELLAALGVGAYRFSIAWPRILPTGTGLTNETGLAFYDRLVDRLLAIGIRPFVTLNHWDLPQKLEDHGGWANRDTAQAFLDYTAVVTKRLGDRVQSWVTHNEPWCIATLGYEQGVHAPGRTEPEAALRVAHHLLLSHGWALPVVRQNARDAEVGIVLNLTPGHPASDDPGDIDAARQFDGNFNRWFLDPLIRGRYPEDVVDDRIRRGHLRSRDLPFVESGDLEIIARPTDFLGVNYYSRVVLAGGENGVPRAVPMGRAEDRTDMGWEVYPWGLFDLLVRLRDEYAVPRLYLTENGAAYADGPGPDGRIQDTRRIEYLRLHLLEAARACAAGVPLEGYFAWSFLDNFEWGEGMTKRFGLYWVDYDTQERIAKDSAAWYRNVVATGMVPLEPAEPVEQ